MSCSIHVSFRNLKFSEAVEAACWREAAAFARSHLVNACSVCVETPSNGVARERGETLVRLDFSTDAHRIRVEQPLECSGEAGSFEERVADALREALRRGESALLSAPAAEPLPRLRRSA